MSSLQIISQIKLNVLRPNAEVVVYGKQYDIASRIIDVDLVSGSEVWDPPANSTMLVMCSKPDGKTCIYDVVEPYDQYSSEKTYEVGDKVIRSNYVWTCRVQIATPENWTSSHWTQGSATTPAITRTGTGKVRIVLAEQALTYPGNVLVSLCFYQDGIRSTTLSFILNVEKSPDDNTVLESSDYFNILSQLIEGLLGATTHPPQIDSNSKNWLIWDESSAQYVDSGYSSVGTQGAQGTQGWSIVSVTKTSGTGAAGTTDVYTIKNNNPNTSQQVVGTFNVYNGNDGAGSKGSAVPLTDSGTGVVGSAVAYSSEDHRHPLNVSSSAPVNVGSSSAGSSSNYARSDHSHAYDMSVIYSAIFPIGYIYISASDTNPGTLFGGTWTRIKGRFLLAAADSGDTAPDTSYYYQQGGQAGGESSHTLTSSESGQQALTITGGAHQHNITQNYRNVFQGGTNRAGEYESGTPDGSWVIQTNSGDGSHTHSVAAANASEAHNNIPPFLAVYMWQRTA